MGKIIVGVVLIAIGFGLVAASYEGGYTTEGRAGRISSASADVNPLLVTLGVLPIVIGGIILAKGIKEYLGKAE